MDDKVHFVVGMSRGGTTWMMRTLNTHPDIVALGETCFWGRLFIEPQDIDRYGAEQKKSVIVRASEPPESIGESLSEGLSMARYKRLDPQSFKKGVVERLELPTELSPGTVFQAIADTARFVEQKPIFVEKTPHHVNWVQRILRFYPRAKFILMERDPYDFMLSYKHLGDGKPDEVKKTLHSLYHPLGCSLVARGYLRKLQEARERLGPQALTIAFSDVKNRPDEVRERVCDFLGVPNSCAALPTQNSSFAQSKRPELTPADVFWMNLVARKEMAGRFGKRPVPSNPSDIAKSFASLVPWGLRASGTLLKTSDDPIKYFTSWLR